MSKGFPNSFLWGAATSAYQVEGATYEDDKKTNQQNIISKENYIKRGFTTADIANNQCHYYKEGITLMKGTDFTTYCFSIAWSRVFPDGVGEVSEAGIQHYHNLIGELLVNGIKPVVTLCHYDSPWALVERYDGWLSREIVKDFACFARYVINESRDKVKCWTTINEQSIIVRYRIQECYIPEEPRGNSQLRCQINHHMNLAHAIACKLVRESVSDGLVGAAIGYSPVYPLTSKPEDIMAAQNAHDLRNAFYLDIYFRGLYTKSAMIYLKEHGLTSVIGEGDTELIKEGYSDFLVLSYYASECAEACLMEEGKGIRYSDINWLGKEGDIPGFETHPGFYGICKSPNPDTTDWNWVIDPTGLEYIFHDIYTRYNKPLMVTENGMGTFDTLTEDGRVHDNYRVKCLRDHTEAVHRAIDYGIEMLAYCPWSAAGPLSTSNGVRERCGPIYVDRTDDDPKECTRIRKDSSYWYKQVIKSNGADL